MQENSLADAFYQRLIDAYGYVPGQLGRDVSIGTSGKADIAIWRSGDEKVKGFTPNIYVLVTCKTEHIKIEAEDYFGKFKQAALNNMAFYVAQPEGDKGVLYRQKRPPSQDRTYWRFPAC